MRARAFRQDSGSACDLEPRRLLAVGERFELGTLVHTERSDDLGDASQMPKTSPSDATSRYRRPAGGATIATIGLSGPGAVIEP